ncbi:hypothetical protein WN943_022658 [Citrus x changshan-huyou]
MRLVIAERQQMRHLTQVQGWISRVEAVKTEVEEPAGIVGLYGMGGVGKTTLLTHINNKFLVSSTDFDCVIWIVVSKDLQLEKIQEIVGKKVDNDAWELLRQKVGLETLDSHHDILELAQTVAKKCVGLPLALITIGRAIACKRTPREWRYAIQVLRTSAYEFSGSGKDLSWGDMYESSFGVKAQE